MKIKELLETNKDFIALNPSSKQEIFSRINYLIISILDQQGDIDISQVVQKLATLLSPEHQKQLISTVNYLIVNDILKTPLDNLDKIIKEQGIKNEINRKISEQFANTLKIQVKDDIREKFNNEFSNELKSEIKNIVKSEIVKENRNNLVESISNVKLEDEGKKTETGDILLSDKQMEQALKAISELKLQPGAGIGNGEAKDEYLIDELGGTSLGITLGRSTKTEVLSIMKKYSTKYNNVNPPSMGKHIVYDDITVTIFFSEQKIAKGLTFGKNYKGKTLKGLKTGDKVDYAVELYGTPQYRTPFSSVWQELAVFCDEPNIISSIRIQI